MAYQRPCGQTEYISPYDDEYGVVDSVEEDMVFVIWPKCGICCFKAGDLKRVPCE